MISQTSEYALRAIVYLARQADGPSVAQDIAAATSVPLGYLQKILRLLSRAGLLVAQRGAGGGFTLAKEPSGISVLDVLTATDSTVRRFEKCPLGRHHEGDLCALHQMLDQEMARQTKTYETTTIADLVARDVARRKGCPGSSILVEGEPDVESKDQHSK